MAWRRALAVLVLLAAGAAAAQDDGIARALAPPTPRSA